MQLKKRIIFLVLFIAIVLIGYQINFSQLVGSKAQYFTFFQFFGPIGGAFLGPIFGSISVLGAELINFFVAGKSINLVNFVRLLPMIFAAYYFGVKRNSLKGNLSIIVPLICIALFVLHPIGRKAWVFSLYWLIPVIAKLFSKKLFFRSLGATFTAHAVGSALWIYTVPMTATQWMTLIPIVAFERTIFALGISISFIGFNTVLHKLNQFIPNKIISIDSKYIISKEFFKIRT